MIFEADQDLEGGPRLFSDAFVLEPLIGRDIYIYPIKRTVSYRHITSKAISPGRELAANARLYDRLEMAKLLPHST